MRLDGHVDELDPLVTPQLYDVIYAAARANADALKTTAAKLEQRLASDAVVGTMLDIKLSARAALRSVSHAPELLDSMKFSCAFPLRILVSQNEIRHVSAKVAMLTGFTLNRIPDRLHNKEVFHSCFEIPSKHRLPNRSLFIALTLTVERITKERTSWVTSAMLFEHRSGALGEDACQTYDTETFTREDAFGDGYVHVAQTGRTTTISGGFAGKLASFTEDIITSLLEAAHANARESLL
jgi:hypothetical protein